MTRPLAKLLHKGYAVSAYPLPQRCRVSRHHFKVSGGVVKHDSPYVHIQLHYCYRVTP